MATEIPALSSWTLCESHCRLVHTQWTGTSTCTAGASFPCIRVPESAQATTLQGATQPQAYVRTQETAGGFIEYNGSGNAQPSRSRGPSDPQQLHGGAAWHPHKPSVAVIGSHDRVLVYDMTAFSAAPKNGSTPATPLAVEEARLELQHELQVQACSVAWRPHCGSQLAVGCKGGVALWCTSGSSRAPVAGSRPADGPAAAGTRPGGGRGPWLSFLSVSTPSARLTDLAWSPDGRLLAAASPELRGLLIWDVATGALTRVAAGFSSLRLLRWAPDGSHLFAASHGSLFYLFETQRWRYQAWDSAGTALPLTSQLRPAGTSVAGGDALPQPSRGLSVAGRLLAGVDWLLRGGRGGGLSAAPHGLGGLTNAHWSPSSRIVLMAFSGSQALVALHVVGEATMAQMMPVALPDIVPADQGAAGLGSGSRRGSGSIADFVWDARGERLGVLLQGSHPATGCIAVFATSCDPVVQARLLGFARPPPLASCQSDAGQAAGPQPGWQLSAHQCFERGWLFSLRLGADFVYNLPLFR